MSLGFDVMESNRVGQALNAVRCRLGGSKATDISKFTSPSPILQCLQSVTLNITAIHLGGSISTVDNPKPRGQH